jgi:tetratricopeptide (TPR) repeat protein
MRRWLAIGWGVLALSCASAVRAEPVVGVLGLGEPELARIAAQLASPDAGARQLAYRTLSELHEESLSGVGARLRKLARRRPAPDAIRAALSEFRRALGSRSAEDAIDIAPGVLPVLERKRDASTLAAAEPLLLLRALERLATREAGQLMGELLVLDEAGVWERELRLARERVGMALLPSLIALRSSPEPRVRSWAQAGVRALGMEDPITATSLPDATLAAGVVRAYGEPLDYQAMPRVVRLVGSDKRQIRDAARATVARFGKNAIWQLRELYDEVAGQPAERGWTTAKTASELYAALDREQIENSETLLAQGLSKFVAGELDAMRERFDRLLALDPDFDGRAKMAPGYAALAALRFEQNQLAAARDAYQRALRLAPDAQEARALRGQLAFVDAELALSRGVADLDGYRAALQHAPALSPAERALDELSGETRARDRQRKRIAAGAAAGLLVVVALLLARGRRARASRARAAAEQPG